MSRSVACIDYRNGKFLIAKRIAHGQMGDRWEFPGGKIEEGEDYTTAIKREMQEEFGCSCKVFEQLAQGTFEHKAKPCSVVAFRVEGSQQDRLTLRSVVFGTFLDCIFCSRLMSGRYFLIQM